MKRLLALFAVVLALAGCSGVSVLESTVAAYSSWPQAPAGAAYRFERLPSQAQSPFQARFEGMVQAQLDQAGWHRDDAGARYTVQIAVRSMREVPLAWGAGWGPGFRRGPYGWSSRFGAAVDFPDYRREASVLIRDGTNNQVVFETHAWHDSSWSDSDPIWNATFAAALYGFPNPPPGTRLVGVQISAQ